MHPAAWQVVLGTGLKRTTHHDKLPTYIDLYQWTRLSTASCSLDHLCIKSFISHCSQKWGGQRAVLSTVLHKHQCVDLCQVCNVIEARYCAVELNGLTFWAKHVVHRCKTGRFCNVGLLQLLESRTAEVGLSGRNGLFHIGLHILQDLLKKFTSFHVGTALQRMQ